MKTETTQSFHLVDKDSLQEFFDEYEWIHLTLGLLGNVLFFGGSILFLFEGRAQTIGV